MQPHLLSRSRAVRGDWLWRHVNVVTVVTHNGDASSALQRILERRVFDRPKFSSRDDFQAKKNWTSVYKIMQ